jgi:class 3 adenylate cyclase/pSer/pThr/pTyr-binding forkhead associated (FHA) protein
MIITYTFPPNPPKRFETESCNIIFGRKPRASQHIDLDLHPDAYVSHVHARLTYEDDEFWIEDLGSENGTWVNDRKIEGKIRVAYGSKIRLGYTIISVERDAQVPENIEARALASDKTSINESIGTRPPSGLSSSVENAFSTKSEDPSEVDIGLVSKYSLETGSAETSDKAAAHPTHGTFAEPAPEGTITSVKDALTPPFSEVEGERVDDTQRQVWHMLKALNNFIQALGTDTTIESLGQLLIQELRHAIPNAQRGALLLPDENGKLLLKAHWPPGEHSVSMTFVDRAFKRREAFIWTASQPSESMVDDNAPQSAIYFDVQSAIYLPLLAGEEVLGVMCVDNYFIPEAFSLTDFELLRAISNQIAMFLKDHVLMKDLQREEMLKQNLLRQYSPKVADRILKKCSQLQRGGEEIDPVTILVSDVRGFTALSSKMEPNELVYAINEMFDAFVPIISDLDGVVDKYVGDSVLAVFGSPENDSHQWEKAVQAAVRMQEAMRMLGEGRKIRRLPVFKVGIGIHTGKVIHGFIGSSERIEFTVIGDTVNRAARFCDGAGPGQIVISKKVFERVYNIVEVDPVTIVSKHPDKEPDQQAYLIKRLRVKGGTVN